MRSAARLASFGIFNVVEHNGEFIHRRGARDREGLSEGARPYPSTAKHFSNRLATANQEVDPRPGGPMLS